MAAPRLPSTSRAPGPRRAPPDTRRPPSLSQFAGSATRARYPGGNSPFQRKWTNGMSYTRSARIHTAKGIQLPRMANSPF
jgi:hypothetical protein